MASQVKSLTTSERIALRGKLERLEADLLAYEMGRKSMRPSHARALSAQAAKLYAALGERSE